MATIELTDLLAGLTAATSVDLNDVIPVVEDGTLRAATTSQLDVEVFTTGMPAASTAQAKAGTSNVVAMTPESTATVLPFTVDVANQYGTDTTALNAAYDAAVTAGGGVLWLRPGTYTYSSNLTWDSNAVSVIGAGSDVVTLQSVGTAKILHARAVAGVENGPRFAGFTVGGTGTASAVGFHLVDITSAEFDDLVIENFTGTGAVGLLIENDNYWTERNRFSRVQLNNNTVGAQLICAPGQISFGYNRWTDLRLNVNAGQVGFQTCDTAYVYHNDFTIIANVADAGVVVDCTETSGIVKGRMLLTAEQTTGSGGIGVRVANGSRFAMTGYRTYGESGLVDDNNSTLSNGGTQTGTLRHLAGTAGANDAYQTQDAGTRPNFVGANTATMIPVIGDDVDNMYAAVGFMHGNTILSTYFTVYNGAGNAFVFYAVPFGGSHGDATEVARITAEGAVRARTLESNTQTVAATGATETLDTSLYGVFDVTMDQNCTFTFSNPAPSGRTTMFTVILRGGFTPTWPAAVDWPSGVSPTHTTPSIWTFTTVNAGTTWYGAQVGKAYA
jgi:hypothetical protein